MGLRSNRAPYMSEDRKLIVYLASGFGMFVDYFRLQTKRQQQERREQELMLHASQSELKALRAQINPHFLFNALNSIAGLIHRSPGLAEQTVEQLAEVFRYTLKRSETEWARLGATGRRTRVCSCLSGCRARKVWIPATSSDGGCT